MKVPHICELLMEYALSLGVKRTAGQEKEVKLDEFRLQAIIHDWYKEWCKKTGRNGGILIGSSIRELLEHLAEKIESQPQRDQFAIGFKNNQK